ncbi:MAG: DUF1523 family protein [Rhodobacteraceae bacterium]|nr:DUF1523 family protein [Paracoccaceae bacterium]
MRRIGRVLQIAFVLLVIALLHYWLPQRDIVRIVGTEIQRVNVGMNAIFYDGRMRDPDGNLIGTDVRFINTVRPNGNTRVYRNEDTNWWPPYLKFDSADLHTEATDLISTDDAPRWVAIRHYGWRSNFLTIYPNAVSMREVESPDVQLIPWFNIVFLTAFAFFVFALWRRWRRFRDNRLTPAVEAIEDSVDDTTSGIARWWNGLFGSKKS